MAIWTIPNDKIIDYSRTGDDIDRFSQKVKWCLEEAFVSLKELHDNSGVGGFSTAITNIENGDTLIYDAITNTFRNEPKIDLNIFLSQSSLARDVAHLQRLVENLYLALDVAGLNPYGYDSFAVATFYGTANDFDATRSGGILSDGKIYGAGATMFTYPIAFVNTVTGASKSISRAHLIVKHQNVTGAEISTELALLNASFVKGEVLAIGTGAEQTIQLAHPNEVTPYKFALYFDGAVQEDFSLEPLSGQVMFTAPNDAVVTADYFYDFGAENFVAMTKSATYPDSYNPNRATTEFVYDGAAGNVATLMLTLGAGENFWIDSFACTFDE